MAYLFDGTNDSLEITKAAGATDLSAVTYVFWLKRPSASGYRDVFWNGGSWSATYHSFIQYDTAGYMALVANWTSAEARWSIPTPDTAWHLHIVSYDFGSSTNDPTWYVDGVSQTITERVSPSGTADYAKDDGSLTIGSGDAGGFEYWSGEIAEFAMYNTILDASARSAIVTANGPSGHSTNRVYYSPMVTNFTDVDGGGSGTVNGATLSIHPFGTGLYAKTSVTTNSGTSTTPSATLPTGGAVGDVLIAIISHNDGTVTVADNNSVIAVSNLTSGTDTDGNTTSTTASVTLPANCLVTLRVNSRTGITANPNQPTATSTGATWVAINSVVYDTTSSSRKRLTVLRTMVASNQTGTIAIDFGGQNQTDVEWSVDTTDATVDTSGTNGSGAVVQSVTNTDADGGAITVTLAAFGSTNNATAGFFANDSGSGTMTVGSGFAALGVNAGATLNGGTEWKNTNDTSVDATFDAVAGATTGGIAIEIKALQRSMTEDYDSGNDAGGLGLAIYSRVLTGVEPATLNFTLSGSDRWAITSFILTGQNATLYDVAISTYDIRLTTTTHTTTGCTTNTDGAMALAIDTLDSGTNTFSAGPGGTWVQVAIVNTGQPLGVYYLKKATAGATGDASFTSASSGNSLAMRQFAIKAAADSIILQSIIANPVASLSS